MRLFIFMGLGRGLYCWEVTRLVRVQPMLGGPLGNWVTPFYGAFLGCCMPVHTS
jgi:hypothetical protein